MAADLKKFSEVVLTAEGFSNRVFIDNTAAEAVPEHYNQWLEAGCHIITPNKKFGSGPLGRYKRGQQLCREHGSQFLYEVICPMDDCQHGLGDCRCWTTRDLYTAEFTGDR